jgi:hypothetical protein
MEPTFGDRFIYDFLFRLFDRWIERREDKARAKVNEHFDEEQQKRAMTPGSGDAARDLMTVIAERQKDDD